MHQGSTAVSMTGVVLKKDDIISPKMQIYCLSNGAPWSPVTHQNTRAICYVYVGWVAFLSMIWSALITCKIFWHLQQKPSGHISHPTQVRVLSWLCMVIGQMFESDCIQLRGLTRAGIGSNEELQWTSQLVICCRLLLESDMCRLYFIW